MVDLEGVSFIDSAGIAVLIEYQRDAAAFDGKFCLARPTEHVRVVFDIVQLRKAITICVTIPNAVEVLRNRRLGELAQPIVGSVADTIRAVAA
ncbi:MAG: STAS domain-containing protein [Verrucomicrobiota bacterium]|nr:STAS domain-containing protein [Verrucomicrobiota bacterium]